MTSAEQAHLNINQGASALRDMYEAQVRENDKLRKRIRTLENMPVSFTPSGSSFSARVVELETRIAVLETTERRLREFMKLKDNAKIKVERTRDVALRRVKSLENMVTVLRSNNLDAENLRAANERQAVAFQDKERQVVEQQRTIRELRGRLDNVMQIMQNAVDGVRSSNPYGEWRPWPEAIPHTTWIDGRDVQGH